MCPCSPSDISLNMPDGPSGFDFDFNKPHALKTTKLTEMLDGFPEDLTYIFEKLEMLLPTGKLKPQLSSNYGKDNFDGILKLLDQFMPYLMLYKLFLPVLNLIVCIIEVLCAIPNPYKLIRAMKKLFTQCLPPFLALFPILAFIILLISLILLLLALIEYIVAKIIALILLILKNLKMLKKAALSADEKGILFILKKIGAVLCAFQNLMVLLAIFTVIIKTIKEILSLSFPIPPCDDSDCCTPEVCPQIVKNEYTRSTGILRYLNNVQQKQEIPAIPPPFNTITFNIRNESWQLYDTNQNIAQKFINITDAYDVTPDLKKIFFPTDAVYTATTDPKQAAYTVDLELFYEPTLFNKSGLPRKIIIKDCIILNPPDVLLNKYDNTNDTISTGVINLAGGKVYEENGTLIPNENLNSFIHLPTSTIPTPLDGYNFVDVKYTFKPNMPVLLSKNLVTLGCEPSLALDKAFVNGIFSSDLALKAQQINNIKLPDTEAAQECLMAALSGFRANISEEGAAEFQTTALLCLSKLKSDAMMALEDLIKIGYDPCKSDLNGTPNIQFTTKPIRVSVLLKDKNGALLTSNIPKETAENLALEIKGYPSFGNISQFKYDGYSSFLADLKSDKPGEGELLVSFNNNTFCRTYFPTTENETPRMELQRFRYEFVYGGTITIAEGDMSDGNAPRRDISDLDISSNSNVGSE